MEKKTKTITEKSTDRRIACIRGVLVAAGILLMGIGIARGEPETIFLKATKICLECIGIG